MKAMIFPLLLAAFAVSTSVAASRVTPSATGKISAIDTNGPQTLISMNGRTYAVSSGTTLEDQSRSLKPGQTATLMLGADGETVIATEPVKKNARRP